MTASPCCPNCGRRFSSREMRCFGCNRRVRTRVRYIGWAVLKTPKRGIREAFVAKAQNETEARELVRKLNQTKPELHWCEFWSTTSILSSEYGGLNAEARVAG